MPEEGAPGHHLYFQPGGLSGRLQILSDGADGTGTASYGGRNRGTGAVRGALITARWSTRPRQHRDDGARRAAAEPGERDQGDAAADRSRRASGFRRGGLRFRPPASFLRSTSWGREPVRPKLAISLNASTEEQRRELMPITRKYHLKDLMEACRGVSAAALGKADLRIRAAQRRQRYRRRCAARGEAAGESERQSESDRAESGPGHPL